MTYEDVLSALTVDRLCVVEDLDEKSLYQPAGYYQRDDRLWKAVLEDLIDDFLRFFFPESYDLFDLDRGIEFLDKEFDQFLSSEDRDAGLRHVDKLVRVFLKNGTEQYLLIHIEVQGQKGKEEFSRRMHRYWCRIRDKYEVPVTALAILTDSDGAFRPQIHIEECLGTCSLFKFNSYKVLDQNEEALRADPNPFALIILTTLMAIKNRKGGDVALVKIKRELIREMLKRDLDKTRRRAVFNFLNHFVHFDSEHTKQTFEKELRKLTNNKITMGTEEYLLDKARTEGIERGIEHGMERGMERGMEKGLRQGKEQFVEYLIAQLRFDDNKTAAAAEVSKQFVREVRQRMAAGRAHAKSAL